MISITKQSIINVLNDEAFLEEAYTLLNDIVDKELEKPEDEINFELIDSCCEAMVEIQTGSNDAVKELLSLFANKEFKEKADKLTVRSLSKSLKVILIAAALMVSMLTITAAAESITGKSILEQIGIESRSEEQTETIMPMQIETTKPEKATENIIVKQDDDSEEIVTEKVLDKDSSFVIKDNQDSDRDLRIGSSINYNKKGDAIKKTEIFIQKDDFDEDEYLTGEYGPIGKDYCEIEDEDGTLFKHRFSEWKIVKPSTCKDRGIKERTCSICGKKQTCPVAKDEKHECKLGKALERASCDNAGRFSYRCKTCGEYFERKQPKVKKTIISQDVFYYNGKTQKPKVIAVLDEEGNEISKEHYTVSYTSQTSKNVYLEYAVTIRFNSKYYEDYIGAHYYIKPMGNEINGITSLNNGFNVYWKKNSLSNQHNTTGYEIEYSLNKNFSNSTKVKVKGMNTLSKMITNLRSEQYYYVRMRVYYYDDITGKNVYSYWSDVRQIKTK